MGQTVRPGLVQLLEAAEGVPAYVVGRRADVLAWNRLAAALFADFGALPADRRNLALLLFLDEEYRRVYRDRDRKAEDLVAYLRLDAGRHPGDPVTEDFLAELTLRSPEFRRHWGTHGVRDKTRGRYRLCHPVAGDLDLSYESLRLPDDPDQVLIFYTAEPGSASGRALAKLRAESG